MSFIRAATAYAMPFALGLAIVSAPAPALAKTSPAFERAMLAEMDAPTRAAVQKRSTGGNTVTGVIATILLNHYQGAGAKHPGAGLTIIAVDFARGVAVLGKDQHTFEIIKFSPQTLQLLP
jgi:hypothetical protein